MSEEVSKLVEDNETSAKENEDIIIEMLSDDDIANLSVSGKNTTSPTNESSVNIMKPSPKLTPKQIARRQELEAKSIKKEQQTKGKKRKNEKKQRVEARRQEKEDREVILC